MSSPSSSSPQAGGAPAPGTFPTDFECDAYIQPRDDGQYQCTWKGCPKPMIGSKTNLRHHMREVHYLMYRPHVCQFEHCRRAFGRQTNLDQHHKDVHGYNKFSQTASRIQEESVPEPTIEDSMEPAPTPPAGGDPMRPQHHPGKQQISYCISSQFQ